MFPKIHTGLSFKQRAQQRVDNCVSHTCFKGSLFSPLCDYLFICLLIYFSLPRVQRACVWCAPMAVFTVKEGRKAAAAAFRSKRGERDVSAYFQLWCKSLWLILGGSGIDIKPKVRSGLSSLKSVDEWGASTCCCSSLQRSGSWPLAVLQETERQYRVSAADLHCSS